MPEYQAYVIGKDGHIKQRLDLICADDAAAKERAKSLVENDAIELWQSDHKIATFDPDPLKAEQVQGWLKSELHPPKQ
ncbi:hypothetical protein [Bradyrhizobium sp. WSM2254]|uniref:hypothetical protein n=1 Tax=Bradyrhizobium sp. WSM2254 TaxID=1188263 RepID=UPI0003FEEF18|nr:hypothetical protein [Bradyrhizobium sp. WSM2254]